MTLLQRPRVLPRHAVILGPAFAHQPVLREFHLSKPVPVHPLIVAAWKPVSRIAALLIGRKMRKWYQELPDDEKKKFKNRLKKNSHIFGGDYD